MLLQDRRVSRERTSGNFAPPKWAPPRSFCIRGERGKRMHRRGVYFSYKSLSQIKLRNVKND